MSTDTPGKPSRKEAREARAAKAQAELEALRKKQARRTWLSIAGVVALIVVVLGVSIYFGSQRSKDNTVSAPPVNSSGQGVTIGKASAPHTVVIYEDFLCPYCGAFEKASHEKLATLAVQGKVRVDYRPFVLLSGAGPYSEESAAAFAVVKDKSGDVVAKKFHDLLYANQPSEKGPFPDTDSLVKLAVEAGAKEADVKAGITGDAGKSWATAATNAATQAGVQGTPTILLDGKMYQKGNNVEEMAQNLLADLS